MDRYQQALNDLYNSISILKPEKFPGELGLLRTQFCLDQLNNPEKSLHVIHIAGTSGKGSTAYILSQLLNAHGHKTGLFLSPHIIDIRERISINRETIGIEEFADIFTKVKSIAAEIHAHTTLGQLTFFEILTIIALLYFKKEKVKYVVLETGLGGAWDATNVIQNKDKISLITRIGFDHTHILGKSLAKIAGQKSGIISKNSVAFVLKQKDTVMNIIRTAANQQTATLHIIPQFKAIDNDLRFIWEPFPKQKLRSGLYGLHQLENTALALACLEYLAQRDNFKLSSEKIANSLSEAELLGRFSVMKSAHFVRPLILDGAHNPQKIRALVEALRCKYPSKKFVFIVAYKRNKDVMSCLKKITPIAKHIYLTTFITPDDKMQPPAFDPFELGNILIKLEYHNFTIAKTPELAFKDARGNYSREIIVITGSMYLLSKVLKFLT